MSLAATPVAGVAFGVGLVEPGTPDALASLPAVGPALAGRAVIETGQPALLVGLFGGVALWISGFPLALVATRRHVEAVDPLVGWLSAAVLAGSGLIFLAEAIPRL